MSRTATETDLATTAGEASAFLADCAAHLADHPRGAVLPLAPVEKVQGLLAYDRFRATAPSTVFA